MEIVMSTDAESSITKLSKSANYLFRAAAAAVVLGTVTAASGADIRVGFINPTGPQAFWNQVNATMLAAASQLSIDVEIRETERSRDKAIAFAKEFASRRPALDYLIATNDVD